MAVNRSPSYLVRSDHGYCFRMRVPPDLQKPVGKKELRYSLKTGSLADAKYKARLISGQILRLFRMIRKDGYMSELTQEQIQEIIYNFILDYVQESERFRANAWLRPLRPDQGEINADEIGNFIAEYKEDLVRCDYRRMRPIIDKELEARAIELDTESDSYGILCRQMLKALIVTSEIDRKREIGDYSDSPDDVILSLYPELKAHPLPQPQAVQQPERTSITLTEAMDIFWKANEGNWKPRTKTQYHTCRKRMLDFFGAGVQIHTLDFPKMREYRDMLSESKNARGELLSVSRIKLFIGFAKQVMGYLKLEKFIPENPVEGLKIHRKEHIRDDERRQPFDADDLRMIFCDSKEYGQDKHRKPENFWLPLIALYTGMRLEEICQLYVTDVKQVDGVWCLDVNEITEDKSTKTHERRLVPLHLFLTDDLSFIGYVNKLRDRNGRVFPALQRRDDRYGHAFSMWFKRFTKRCGIVAPPNTKVFHSFRHNVETNLDENDIDQKYIDDFVGHAHRGTGKRFYRESKKSKPRILFEKAVKHIDYGIDLSHLKESRFVKYLITT